MPGSLSYNAIEPSNEPIEPPLFGDSSLLALFGIDWFANSPLSRILGVRPNGGDRVTNSLVVGVIKIRLFCHN